MIKAAENKGKMQVIGVTVLTNLDERDLRQMGFDKNISVENLVMQKTKMAIECGLDGVVSSALEAKKLRESFGDNFLIVTPGIRLNTSFFDDQKRVADVATAIRNGASHLVVGRPITHSKNPKEAAQKFMQLIHEAQ